ncbi:cysteine dioxygenase, partial [Streptomyces scabiei]|nr:cysteine dioxygenase [Streptomyces scabiei]
MSVSPVVPPTPAPVPPLPAPTQPELPHLARRTAPDSALIAPLPPDPPGRTLDRLEGPAGHEAGVN